MHKEIVISLGLRAILDGQIQSVARAILSLSHVENESFVYSGSSLSTIVCGYSYVADIGQEEGFAGQLLKPHSKRELFL